MKTHDTFFIQGSCGGGMGGRFFQEASSTVLPPGSDVISEQHFQQEDHDQVEGVEDIEAVFHALDTGLSVIEGQGDEGKEAIGLDIGGETAGDAEDQHTQGAEAQLNGEGGQGTEVGGGLSLLIIGQGGEDGDEDAPEAVADVEDMLIERPHADNGDGEEEAP